MSSYSFLDTLASISGPNGTFPIGSGAGVAEEGITIARVGDKNTMTIGADGSSMHSMHGSNAGKCTVRLLKTSPTNQLLNQLYNSDRLPGAANWGQNVIALNNLVSGDAAVLTRCAFTKHPDLVYAQDGGLNEWEFDVGHVNETLGALTP